ncbi:hypothetical protein CN204_34845 [Sinorhizobium meliloti]|nr:hypothetical protein CN204_34845 [Sinorhizobium meliloti]RVM17283.1 hypothetical protein CN132_35335 [Sinorhizobium meliloti]RVN97965.1 hypothetical protein CN102_35305 [Sinorhizobium meliloti]RVO55295.1 hypothetical protein CN094_25575 [Sinorhizobium meliloti]RVP19632.1 hypothetical protein CN109_23390 [Sinorhizobium meliloti]
MVEVRHDEGVANHIGPEPCAGAREGVGEALAGEHVGQPLSREIASSWMPTPLSWRKATWEGALLRAPDQSGAVVDPGMHGSSLRGNREISGSTPTSSIEGVVRSGKVRSRSR